MTTFADRAEVLPHQTEALAKPLTDAELHDAVTQWSDQQCLPTLVEPEAGFELVEAYDPEQFVGPMPHHRYVTKTWDQATRDWVFDFNDMSPNEDHFVYLFFQKSAELRQLKPYFFPWHMVEIIRGERPETVVHYPDGNGGRAEMSLSRQRLMQLAGSSLLKYIL